MGRFLALAEKAERELGERQLDHLRRHCDEVRHFLGRPGGPTQQDGKNLPPIDPCYVCGGVIYWRRPSGGYVCAECHPDPRWIPVLTRIQ
jgi:hypothetical protein